MCSNRLDYSLSARKYIFMTVEAVRPAIEEVSPVQKSSDPEILGEETLYQQGCFRTVRRYLRDWHPELGILSNGWQGPETIVVQDVIRPIGVFRVLEASAIDNHSNGTIAVDKVGAVTVK